MSRLMGRGEPFVGKTEDITIDVISDTQGEWFTGLETLNSSAANTTITLSYAQTNFTQPKVSVLVESIANTGQQAIIPLDVFKYEKAASEALQKVGSAAYGTGAASQPDGLGAIVDDGTVVGTIGGQSRSTYPVLDAVVTASAANKISLGQMATLHDNVSAAGLIQEEPNLFLTTKTVWSLYEQLLTPNVRAQYNEVGYQALPVRGEAMLRSKAELKNAAGFSALSYRGAPVIKDDFATAGVFFALNENYYNWKGREIVPDEYRGFMHKVDLGTAKAYEGTGAEALEMPSEYNGWFYQDPLILPNQAGTIARFYVFGQIVASSFRREGKLTGITGV